MKDLGLSSAPTQRKHARAVIEKVILLFSKQTQSFKKRTPFSYESLIGVSRCSPSLSEMT